MKRVCGGKINSIGVCEKCLQTSQSSSGQCTRLVEALSTKEGQQTDEVIVEELLAPYKAFRSDEANNDITIRLGIVRQLLLKALSAKGEFDGNDMIKFGEALMNYWQLFPINRYMEKALEQYRTRKDGGK